MKLIELALIAVGVYVVIRAVDKHLSKDKSEKNTTVIVM